MIAEMLRKEKEEIGKLLRNLFTKCVYYREILEECNKRLKAEKGDK